MTGPSLLGMPFTQGHIPGPQRRRKEDPLMEKMYQKGLKLRRRPASPRQDNSDQQFQFSCPTAWTQVGLSHSCL